MIDYTEGLKHVKFQSLRAFNIRWEMILVMSYYGNLSRNYSEKPRSIKELLLFFRFLKGHFVAAFRSKYAIESESAEYLFFKSLQRKDYDSLFDLIVAQCSKSKSIMSPPNQQKGFDFYFLYSFFVRIRELFGLFKSDFSLAFVLYCKYIKHLSLLRIISRKRDFRKLVVFSDMQPLDNLLVQYANYNKIRTATMQHGLYVDYSAYPNVNKINYENVVSNYFLAWGEETACLIKKYHPEVEVVVCGKPLSIDGQKPTDHCERLFTVLFDQNIFSEYNKQLLSYAYTLARKLNYKIVIAFHPYNNKNDYDLRDEHIVDKDMFMSEFFIGHTTSIIYELIRYGYPVYKLRSSVPSNNFPSQFMFGNAEELVELISDIGVYNVNGSYYINQTGIESLHEYKKFFQVF